MDRVTAYCMCSYAISGLALVVAMYRRNAPADQLDGRVCKAMDRLKKVESFIESDKIPPTDFASLIDSVRQNTDNRIDRIFDLCHKWAAVEAGSEPRLDGHDATLTKLDEQIRWLHDRLNDIVDVVNENADAHNEAREAVNEWATGQDAKYAELCRRMGGIELAMATKAEIAELDERLDGLSSEVVEIEPKAVIAVGMVLCKLQDETNARLAKLETPIPVITAADCVIRIDTLLQPSLSTLTPQAPVKTAELIANEWIKRTGREPHHYPPNSPNAGKFRWFQRYKMADRDDILGSLWLMLESEDTFDQAKRYITSDAAYADLRQACVKLIQSGGTLPEIEP